MYLIVVVASLIMPTGVIAQSSALTGLIAQYIDLYDHGRLAEAESTASEAIQLARQELGKTDARIAILLRDLAEISKASGKLADALRLNAEALALTETGLGKDHPDVAALLLERADIYRSLGRFADAASAYERATNIDQRVIASRGFRSSFGGSGLGGLGPKMINSVYDFFDRESGELEGYGRYTYVLIPNPSSRNAKFLKVLLKTTRPGETLTFNRDMLNVFYIPVRKGYQDAARDLSTKQIGSAADVAAPIAGAYYDHSYATDLLSQLCDTRAEVTPGICATALSQGPYLVTLSKRFNEHKEKPGPFLIADLSDVHPDAFRKFTDEVKVQVKQADFTDLERIQQTRLKLLNIILVAGDWLSAVKPAVAEIVELVAPLRKKK